MLDNRKTPTGPKRLRFWLCMFTLKSISLKSDKKMWWINWFRGRHWTDWAALPCNWEICQPCSPSTSLPVRSSTPAQSYQHTPSPSSIFATPQRRFSHPAYTPPIFAWLSGRSLQPRGRWSPGNAAEAVPRWPTERSLRWSLGIAWFAAQIYPSRTPWNFSSALSSPPSTSAPYCNASKCWQSNGPFAPPSTCSPG